MATATKTKEVEQAPAEALKEKFDFGIAGVKISKPRRADDHFSMLLYGVPKAGKTLLAGTAAEVPELSPVLVLALEDGTSVLARDYGDDPNLDVVELEDWATAANVIQQLADGGTPYKTVIIDTIGELQEQMKAHISGGGAMTIPGWGVLADNTANLVKMLHRSGLNVIIVSHSERTKDESSGVVSTEPYFLGKKSLGEVPKVVDVIAYLGVVKEKGSGEMIRVLQTGTDGKITAGDRFGKLETQIVNPSMAEIWAQLHADPTDATE